MISILLLYKIPGFLPIIEVSDWRNPDVIIVLGYSLWAHTRPEGYHFYFIFSESVFVILVVSVEVDVFFAANHLLVFKLLLLEGIHRDNWGGYVILSMPGDLSFALIARILWHFQWEGASLWFQFVLMRFNAIRLFTHVFPVRWVAPRIIWITFWENILVLKLLIALGISISTVIMAFDVTVPW